MYPEGATTFVTVEDLSSRLDGASRPGHFRGVATVVAKLFHIVQPDVAFFGQKDAAQVAVLRRMVRDLNFDLEIAVIPTVREPDGLAMSSRNRYLSPQERKSALALSQALSVMESMANTGERDSDRLLTEGRRKLATEPGVRLDYLSIVHPETLEPLENVASGALIAVAAYVGTTRLIDNILLPPAH
jgi:pantoate--beta-alanine ligase